MADIHLTTTQTNVSIPSDYKSVLKARGFQKIIRFLEVNREKIIAAYNKHTPGDNLSPLCYTYYTYTDEHKERSDITDVARLLHRINWYCIKIHLCNQNEKDEQALKNIGESANIEDQ